MASLEFYDPLGAGIGRNVTGWHCRRSSLAMQNIWGIIYLELVFFFAVVRTRVKEPCRAFFLCVFAEYLHHHVFFPSF